MRCRDKIAISLLIDFNKNLPVWIYFCQYLKHRSQLLPNALKVKMSYRVQSLYWTGAGSKFLANFFTAKNDESDGFTAQKYRKDWAFLLHLHLQYCKILPCSRKGVTLKFLNGFESDYLNPCEPTQLTCHSVTYTWVPFFLWYNLSLLRQWFVLDSACGLILTFPLLEADCLLVLSKNACFICIHLLELWIETPFCLPGWVEGEFPPCSQCQDKSS